MISEVHSTDKTKTNQFWAAVDLFKKRVVFLQFLRIKIKINYIKNPNFITQY